MTSRFTPLVLLMTLVLSSCSPTPDPRRGADPSMTTTTTTTTEAPSTTVAEDKPTTQPSTTSTRATTAPSAGGSPPAKLELSGCHGSFECGSIEVPVDYDDPSLGQLKIAVVRHPAEKPDERIGVLVINPGGPGASGIEFAEYAPFGFFSQEIVDRFDIVGFDPRGVGTSEPEFECGTDEEWIADEKSIDGDIDTPEEQRVARDAVASCETSMGPAAMRLGTDFVVRDIDQIRSALGEEQISFYGASYGSTMGAWYATRFPDRVRAMVVDGADNPADDTSSDEAIVQESLEEVEQLEAKLKEALEACDSPSCPAYNNGDPVGYYLGLIDDLTLVDDEFGGNPSAGSLAVVTPLYDESQWPLLWSGLASLDAGDPTPLAQLAERQLSGEYGASDTAHINCLDAWSIDPEFDLAEQQHANEIINEAFAEEIPLLYALPIFREEGFCSYFADSVPAPLGQPFDGGGEPIIVIANVSDPVTPFTESEELVGEQLSNGYLVVADQPRHVVYPDDPCVQKIVDDYLLDLTLPAEHRVDCTN